MIDARRQLLMGTVASGPRGVALTASYRNLDSFAYDAVSPARRPTPSLSLRVLRVLRPLRPAPTARSYPRR